MRVALGSLVVTVWSRQLGRQPPVLNLGNLLQNRGVALDAQCTQQGGAGHSTCRQGCLYLTPVLLPKAWLEAPPAAPRLAHDTP